MSEMNEYKIEVEILSEAIFTSGEKERNLVQSRAQTDSNGFVYFHGKTLKGQLKRQAFWLLGQYAKLDMRKADSFLESLIKLFGINSNEIININNRYGLKYSGEYNRSGLMRLSNLELDEKVRNYFIACQIEDEANGYYRISPHDLIEAQTHVRTGIQLEDGVIKNKMLNTFHTVRKGLVFYSAVSFENVADDADLLIDDLAKIVYSFRRIGAGIHRGRGEIKSRLLISTNKNEEPYYEYKYKGDRNYASI